MVNRGNVGIWFESGSQKIRLPVNPPDITLKKAGLNTTENVINLGKVNVLNTPDLITFTLKSFFPANENNARGFLAASEKEFKKPEDLVAFFQDKLDNKKYFRMILHPYWPSVIKKEDGEQVLGGMLVSVENFTWGARAGFHDDVEYELELKQFRPYKAYWVHPENYENLNPSVERGNEDNAWIYATEYEVEF